METNEHKPLRRGRGLGKKPAKAHFTIRLDYDIFEWLAKTGRKSSAGINKLLRKTMGGDNGADTGR